MHPRPLERAERARIFRSVGTLFFFGLACVLMVAALAACGPASRTATSATSAPQRMTPTATLPPLPPAPAGVYAVTPRALDVLSPDTGAIQHSYPYSNPGAGMTGAGVSPMVIAGGAVYFVVGPTSSDATVVMALRASDGSARWSFPMPKTSSAPGLSVVDDMVFVAGYAVGFPGTFYALSARDGHELWQTQAQTIRPPATVVDGVVYLDTQPNDGSQHLLALRATDGKQLWDFTVPGCGQLSAPVVDNGMVYLSCAPGAVYSIRAADGKLMWHDGSLGASASQPAVGNGLVYVVAGGCGIAPTSPCPPSYVYAFDEQTGAARWRIQGGGSALVAGATALYGYLNGALTALDPATGAVRWSYSLASAQRMESPTPTLAGGALYFEGDERLIAIDAATGTLLWRSPTLVDQNNPTLSVFVVPQS